MHSGSAKNFHSACVLAEARSRLCCDFPLEFLYFLLRKYPTIFHFPPPTDMPGCSRTFPFSCLSLTSSLFLPEEETAASSLTQWHCRQPCVLTDSLLLFHFFLSRQEILVTISESGVSGTGGIRFAHCFCDIRLLGDFNENKSRGIGTCSKR